MRLFFYSTLFFLLPFMALAQASQHTTDFQVWLDPTINYNLAPRVRLSNDLYYRTKLNDLQWKQTVVRPGLAFTWSKRVIVVGGVGWFRIKDHVFEARNELRYWGGVQYTHPLFRKIDLQHYIRIEERVFSQNGYEGYNNLRLRYRLGASYPIKEKDEKGKSAVVLLQYEPFLTVNEGKLNEQFFNTERLYFGASNTLSPKVRFDVYYMLQWGRVLKMDDFEFTDHILQLKLNYTLNPL